MSKAEQYLALRKRHEEELSAFPVAYAFSDEQLKEALKKLGVESTKECCTVFGHGDIVKKSDARRFIDMFKRHADELREAMKNEDFAEGAFLYEMDNHEYAINYSGDEDVLDCFSMTEEDLVMMNLEDAYNRARNAHFRHAREWDMI